MNAWVPRAGRAIDSLVLATVFLVLLPMWLLGNLFVAIFPANTTVPAEQFGQTKNTTTVQNAVALDSSPTLGSIEASHVEAIPDKAAALDQSLPESSLAASPPAPLVPSVTNGLFRDEASLEVATHQHSKLPLAPEVRLWTRRVDGKMVPATLLRVEGDEVYLLTAEGKELLVPIAVFAEVDQEYIQRYR